MEEFIKSIKEKFVSHPGKTGESYLKHLLFALKICSLLLLSLVALLVHAIFPFILQNTATEMIDDINWQLKIRSME